MISFDEEDLASSESSPGPIPSRFNSAPNTCMNSPAVFQNSTKFTYNTSSHKEAATEEEALDGFDTDLKTKDIPQNECVVSTAQSLRTCKSESELHIDLQNVNTREGNEQDTSILRAVSLLSMESDLADDKFNQRKNLNKR